jgi:hypothetical protein
LALARRVLRWSQPNLENNLMDMQRYPLHHFLIFPDAFIVRLFKGLSQFDR